MFGSQRAKAARAVAHRQGHSSLLFTAEQNLLVRGVVV